jgi:hypothetical protein
MRTALIERSKQGGKVVTGVLHYFLAGIDTLNHEKK